MLCSFHLTYLNLILRSWLPVSHSPIGYLQLITGAPNSLGIEARTDPASVQLLKCNRGSDPRPMPRLWNRQAHAHMPRLTLCRDADRARASLTRDCRL